MLELAQLFMSIAGFGLPLGVLLLMSGRVKSRNELDTLTRIITAFCVSMVCFWLFGFSFYQGDSLYGIIGHGALLLGQTNPLNGAQDLGTIYLFSVAPILATAALVERGSFISGSLLAAFVATLIVPITAHWVWHTGEGGAGWLAAQGFIDSGGSVVIFVTAGLVALAVSATVGPRAGRFPLQSDRPRGHSPTYHALGVILMIFGLALLCGLQVDSVSAMPAVLFSVLLGASFAAVASLMLLMLQKRIGSAMDLLASALAGSVALTAFAQQTSTANAALAGLLAGVVCMGLRRLLGTIEIDDPGDLVASFLAGGLIGGLVAPALSQGGTLSLVDLLVVQLIGIAAISAWAFGLTYVAAQILARLGKLRVSEEEETLGLSRANFGLQSELDFLVSQLLATTGKHYGAPQTRSAQLSQIATGFSELVVRLRTETHRATDRILATSTDAKKATAMTANIRLAEDTLRVKAEDILLLLDSTLTGRNSQMGGAQFQSWLGDALAILMAPTLKDLDQFSRHLQLQANFEELETIVIAAADGLSRTAHHIDLLRDLTDARAQGFFSRDHSLDLAALLQEKSSLLLASAEVRNSPIQIDCPVESGMMVAGDSNAFNRILLLLVEAALNRLNSADGQPLRMELKEQAGGHAVILECLDTGSALSPRQIRAVLDPFKEGYALEHVGLSQILPLMLVARIIKAIGGEITIVSEEGLGTQIHCRFRKASQQVSKRATRAA